MTTTTPPLISTTALIALKNNKDLVLVDAGAKQRNTPFLAGAVGVDLEEQLSNIKANAAHGGRHPLPTVAQFSKELGNLGISPQSHVVVYDTMYGSNAAARFWWMLTAVGHSKVQVLNGGAQKAIAEGYPQAQSLVEPYPVDSYPATTWQLGMVEMDAVERATRFKDHIIIDVRDARRYAGEIEPIDVVAGHIPNAINLPFMENLDEDGYFKSAEELQSKYRKILGNIPAKQVIVHCGSGVTACHTLLALAHAQMDIPNLYVGSWSEWSRNDLPFLVGN
jgi:thiosulfate/3-mercaptopyruvate sulfurtransferase